MSGAPASFTIEPLSPARITAEAEALARVLVDCVEGGASVGFLSGLTQVRAEAYWRALARAAAADGRVVLAAFSAPERILVGTVQMSPAQFENQPHRADIAKMLVMRSARRHGIGRALMHQAEAEALRTGRTVVVLDTANPDAARLYGALGWTQVGCIPDYAQMPDGTLCATTLFYKRLGPLKRP